MANFTVPPSVFHTRPTTNGVANTSNVGVALLGAAGVGAAYRIVGISLAAGREVLAANNVEVVYIDSTGITMWAGMVSGGGGTAIIMYPFPGIQLPVNASLTMTNISNAATMTYRTVVYYYTDTVT